VSAAGPWRAGLLALAFSVSLGLLDWATGLEASFAVFYLAPVAYATWYGGRTLGFVVAGVATTVWYEANDLVGQQFSHPATAVWNATTRLGFFLVTVLLLARLRRDLGQEADHARRDFLTGTANARAFRAILETEATRASAGRAGLSLAYVDLDDFKAVNDTLGQVAAAIARNVRGDDVVARLGGDEFAVILPRCDGAGARLTVDRVHAAVLDVARGYAVPVGVSIGVVSFAPGAADAAAMVRAADAAMYAAKRAGKNRVEYRVDACATATEGGRS